MAAEKITMEEIMQMDLPPIILYAIPVMVFLVLVEYLISVYQKKKVYVGKDLLASALVGAGNLVVSAGVKLMLFSIVLFFYNLVPWRIPHTWWSYVLCIVAIDFCRYWAHRLAHHQNFWWATHVTHHSSEQYYFGVSFRLSWVQHIKVIFFIPAILCGFNPFVFFICHQIEILYQFWIHTEFIRKLPAPIEYIFTTPSHHRVHHAINEKYIDKNYGSTFIFWDRMFGTFQQEEEQPIYGITTPVKSYNPVYLVFHIWIDIFRDLRDSKTWSERWKILFGKPGTHNKEAAMKLAPTKLGEAKAVEKEISSGELERSAEQQIVQAA